VAVEHPTSSVQVGNFIVVWLEEEEDDGRRWAPAEVMKKTKEGFDVYYMEPCSDDGAGGPSVLAGVFAD